MKNIKLLLIGIVCAFALVSCGGGDDGPKKPKLAEKVVGQWKLISFTNSALASFEVYVEFKIDKTFVIYQNPYDYGFQAYYGTYTIEKDVIKGIYTDNSPWAAEYNCTIDETTGNLTLSTLAEQNTFTKATIPASVISDATDATKKPVVTKTVVDFRLL